VLLLALAPAGCGNERRPAPEVSAEPSEETQTLDYPGAGLRLDLPRNFTVQTARRPGVFRATFGPGSVSAFAYRRREELPGSDADLAKALERLETATKKRSSSFELSESRTLELDGARAVELLGSQTISQTRLRTRSLHVFKGKAEYVIELLAPPREFRSLDRRVLGLIRSSLELTGDVTPAGDAAP